MSELLSPVLWGRPSGNHKRADRLVVVGPYPSAEFFTQVKEILAPKHVTLVVDEGWREQVIESIRELFDPNVNIRYASCAGLVHAKLYFVEWRHRGGSASRTLLWGSANASCAGFESGKNAEVLSSVPIAENARGRKVIEYFDHLTRHDEGEQHVLDLHMAGDLRLLLPAFRFHSEPEPQTFAGWLQSGVLCHQFQRDQTFARIAVNLIKPLPRGELEKLFGKLDLIKDSESKTFRKAYVKASGSMRGNMPPRWRTKYFVETWLGHWTSVECYQHHQDAFVARDKGRRQELIKKIKGAGGAEQAEWTNEFVKTLQQAATRLVKAGHTPGDYLACHGNRISKAHYQKLARKQIENHQRKTGLSSFCNRFVTGFEFPSVPSFRSTEASMEWSFDDFVLSWCESLVAELNKRRKGNRLASSVDQAIQEYAEQDSLDYLEDVMTEQDIDEQAQALKHILEEHWSELGPQVRAFWQSPSESEEEE